ncbi:MAG: hypothetical protein QOJ11_3495 [Frankiales bacterium]|nr:hypothetical protein [Frankiales bacterium]
MTMSIAPVQGLQVKLTNRQSPEHPMTAFVVAVGFEEGMKHASVLDAHGSVHTLGYWSSEGWDALVDAIEP